jgi:hypothetical protein
MHDQIDFDARLDLTAAILERDDLRRRYEEVEGTRADVDAFVALHAANVRVNARRRYLHWTETTPLGTYPHPDDAELAPYELCDECAARFEVAEDGTDDRTQFDLGTPASPLLAAELNREAALGGEPRICPPEHARGRRFARSG